MNTEDKNRFARYRKGYIEPSIDMDNINNLNNLNNTKSKQTLGYINKIDVKSDVLINQIIKKT